MHDFDKSGLGILHSFRASNRRFRFKGTPRVFDFGLRLADVRRLSLTAEAVEHGMLKESPREKLAEYGADPDELAFLVHDRKDDDSPWVGERVELNAMTVPQVIRYVEDKLAEHGVRKFVPDAVTVVAAYERAARIATVQAAADEAVRLANRTPVTVPPELLEHVAAFLRDNPAAPWDEAVYQVARRHSAG